jgi:heme/copper-type cytochrome/quinol oxidase subunit 2
MPSEHNSNESTPNRQCGKLSQPGARDQIKKRLMWLAGALLMQWPSYSWAIPGSGDFTSLQSPTGREIAGLYNMLAVICLVIFIIVCIVMGASIALFRRKSDDDRPAQIHGNMKIEMGLLIAATLVQVFIGYKTVGVMWYVEKMPAKTDVTIEAIGYQWDWQFRYPEHGFVAEDLVIPAHTNVRLEITSKDVIHSLFVPELGIKMDAVPGRFNYWWVNADGPINQIRHEGAVERAPRATYDTTRPQGPLRDLLNAASLFEPAERAATTRGLEQKVTYLAASRANQVGDARYEKYDAVEYRGMCTELCGKGHYNMYFRVVAMTPASYNRWIQDMKSGGGKEANGAEIYNGKCASCHGADGNGVGGSFPPLAGSEWVNVDNEENKRKHIEVVLSGLKGEIQVKGVKYNGVMQAWFNVFNDEEVAAVVNHERVSWGNAGGVVDAKLVAEVRAALSYPPYPAGGAEPVAEADLMAEGGKIYGSCESCHGADGKALPGLPNIAGNPAVLADPTALVSLLVKGQDDAKWPGSHSPMGQSMTDRELAAIITYVRKSFGNNASSVQPDEIGRARKNIK